MELFWNYSDTFFPFLVGLVLLVAYPRRQEGYGLLLVYLTLTTLLMGYSNYLADRGITNLYVYHLYSLVEVALLLPLLMVYSKKRSRTTYVVMLAYILFWLVNFFRLEGPLKFNSNSASIAALVIAGFCFRYFLLLAQTDNVMYFQRLSSFWVVSGFLFYCIVSVLVIGSYKYKDWFTDIDTHITWRIQQVANIIKFVLISIGIICYYRPTFPGGSS